MNFGCEKLLKVESLPLFGRGCEFCRVDTPCVIEYLRLPFRCGPQFIDTGGAPKNMVHTQEIDAPREPR